RSCTLEPSPVGLASRGTRRSHPSTISRCLLSGTLSLHIPGHTDLAQISPPSVPASPYSLSPLPFLQYTTLHSLLLELHSVFRPGCIVPSWQSPDQSECPSPLQSLPF